MCTPSSESITSDVCSVGISVSREVIVQEPLISVAYLRREVCQLPDFP